MNYFPRFVSGLIEIDDAWLRSPVISGNMMPFGSVTIGSPDVPFSNAYVSDVYNRFGQMLINDAISSSVIDLSINEGTLSGNLRFNQTLQIDDAGNLGVTQQIVSPAGIEYTYIDPLFCEPDPLDNSKARVILKYDEDSFNLTDEGKLKTVDLNITSGGAIRVRKADWTLGETDSRLRVISIDVSSSDFQQTGGVLAIRSQGPGRIPFYQVGSGFSSNGQFSYDGAGTLSVQFVKLTESFTLPDNYAAPIGYVMQAYQAGVNTGLDISAAANGRRIISARTDPSSILIDQNNNLSVKLDASGALKKDIQLGLDVKTDATGVIFKDASAGNALDARCDGSSIQKVAGSLSVNLQEFGGLKVTAAGVGVSVDGVTVVIGADNILNGGYRAMFPLQLPTGTSELSLQFSDLTMKTDATGLTLNLSETDRGLQVLADGLGVRTQTSDPIKSGYDGLYLNLSPDDSCLAKTATGLEVTVAPDGPMRKELLGLDIAVDGVTIKKTLAGLVCGLRGDVDGDITVTPAGLILCNISAGQGLQKLGTVISALPNTELEDKVDQAKNAADAAADTANQAAQQAGDLADRIGDLSSVVEGIGDLGKTIGISVGSSMLTSAVTSSIAAAALAIAAKSAAQNLVTSKSALAMGGIGAAFAGLFGAIGGAIAGAAGKRGNQNTYISYNSFSNSGMKEKESDDEEDQYLYGYSICCGTDYSIGLFPDRALCPCVVTPLLGSDLLPVESSDCRSGQLCVEGGLGVSGYIHAGKEVFANDKRLATEEHVAGLGYMTSDAAESKFQAALTVENPLVLSYDKKVLGINLYNYTTNQQTDAAIATAVAGLASQTWVNGLGFITSAALIDFATESYVDASVSGKMDSFDLMAYYTKTETDNLFANYYTKASVYTRAETDTLLGGKQPRFSVSTSLGYNTTTNVLSVDLSAKENTLTFSAPLTRSVNTVGIDLSAFYTRTQVDSLVGTKQGTISVTSPITLSGSTIGINTPLITSLGTLTGLRVTGVIEIPRLNYIHFGYDAAGKDPNAGKMGYELFTAGALDIVGAGVAGGGANRNVKIFDNLYVATNMFIGSNAVATQAWSNTTYYNKTEVNNLVGAKQGTINWNALPNITATNVTSTGYVATGNYLYVRGGGGSDGSLTYGAIAMEYQTGGYIHWISSRHHGGQIAGNAIDFYIANQPASGQGGSSSPGVGNSRRFVIDLGVVAVEGVPLRVNAGIELNGGNVQIPVGGNGICWGATASKIYDDAQLHIYTDDNLYFDLSGQSSAFSMNTTGATFLGTVRTAGKTVNLGIGTPDIQGTYICWNRSAGSGRTSIINQIGGGNSGGFEFLTFASNNTFNKEAMYLDHSGNLTAAGDITANWTNARLNLGVLNSRISLINESGNGSGDVFLWDGFGSGRNILGYYRANNLTRISASSLLLPGMILHEGGGLGAPTYTSRSPGTRMVLWGGLGASSVDYGLGMNSGTMWFSVPTNNEQFKWYAGQVDIMTLGPSGFSVKGQLNGYSGYITNVLTAGSLKTNYIEGGDTGANCVALRINTGAYTNIGVFTANSQACWCDIPLVVNANNLAARPISFDWSNLPNSSGGGLQVNCHSVFKGTILLTGAGSTSKYSEFRYYSVNGTAWVGYNTANYSLIVGGDSRILLSYNGEINIMSDDRLKESIVPIDPDRALSVISKQRSIAFKYKNNPSGDASAHKPQKYGFSAQELLQHEYTRDLVTQYRTDDNETLVMDNASMIPIMWAGIRALIARVEKLEGGQ